MYILGLKTSGHDTSAVLLKNGVIVAASAQERFDRKKHSGEFPKDAINFCLKKANISLKQVSLVVIPFNYPLALSMLIAKFTLKYFPRSINATKTLFPYLLNKWVSGEKKLREIGYLGKIKYIEHHHCHAASAYFPSNFDSSAILTIDARGENASTCVYIGDKCNIKRIDTLACYPHSLGYLYTAVTAFLGFKKNSGEGKVMGLAPYGNWKKYRKYSNILKLLPNGRFEIDLSYFSFHLGINLDVSKKFEKIFGPRRINGSKILKRHKDVAAFFQYIVENAVLHCAKFAIKKSGELNLCMAGGVSLNSTINGKLLKIANLKELFIQPASTDDGSALGAALLAFYLLKNQSKIISKNIVYLGPNYSEEDIKKALDEKKITYKKYKNIFEVTAKEIANKKIVAWYQGRSEFGPRALGNRSILADPRDHMMKDRLNNYVKFRESFRPFAPSVIENLSSKYFYINKPSPYMLFNFRLKKKYINLLPAISHIDNTSRIQTVSKKQNLKYWKLIKEFGDLTNIYMVLNTSFNIKSDPIVNTPQEAIDAFLNSGIDILVMENYFVKKI